MKIKDIASILSASILCGESYLDEDFGYAFASDLMSDILTLGDRFPIIITGLCTMQTIRTCEMANLDVIIIVRNKKPSVEMVSLARDNGMVMMTCESSMFKTCGLLWEAGMKPVY